MKEFLEGSGCNPGWFFFTVVFSAAIGAGLGSGSDAGFLIGIIIGAIIPFFLVAVLKDLHG